MRLSRNKLHPTEVNIHGRKLVGHNGELNANDRSELLTAIASFMQSMAAGDVMTATDSKVEAAEKKQARIRDLAEAYADQDSGRFKALGSAVAENLHEYANREGFMRRVLLKTEVAEGGIPRIKVTKKATRAVMATGPSQVQPTYAQDIWLLPPEFTVHTSVLISELDMRQTSSDLLEEKLTEAQESIMVREDRLWKQSTDALLGIKNNEVTISGTLSPANLAPLLETLRTNTLNPIRILMAADLWTDISTGANFQTVYDPVSQYELIQTGYLGRIYGMEFLTDGYRPANQKVLNRGEIYIQPEAEYLGWYTERGPVTANEINNTTNGKGEPSRGWYLYELISMGVHNPAAVVKATRI